MNIDRQSLGIIISRILGIYVLVHALDYFPMIPAYFRGTQATDILSRLPAAGAFLFTLGLSYFLLVHSSRASQFLMSETQELPKSGSIDLESVARTAFLIIGGFLVVRSIPPLIGQIVLYSQNVLMGPAAGAEIVQSSVQLLLGLFLVIGGRTFESLLRRLRS